MGFSVISSVNNNIHEISTVWTRGSGAHDKGDEGEVIWASCTGMRAARMGTERRRPEDEERGTAKELDDELVRMGGRRRCLSDQIGGRLGWLETGCPRLLAGCPRLLAGCPRLLAGCPPLVTGCPPEASCPLRTSASEAASKLTPPWDSYPWICRELLSLLAPSESLSGFGLEPLTVGWCNRCPEHAK